MKIEEVKKTELTQLLVVFNEAKASTTGFTNLNTEFKDFFKSIAGEKIYVAKVNNNIAGFLSIWEQENFIHHLYVLPKFQNLGIGKALLQECEKKYGLPLKLKCVKANTKASTFYERNGWTAKTTAIGPEGLYVNYRLEET